MMELEEESPCSEPSEKAASGSSSESVFPASSLSNEWSSGHSLDTSVSSDNSAREKQNIVKEHAISITRLGPREKLRTSTPINSDSPHMSQSTETSQHLSSEESTKVKETSSSDEVVGPSVDRELQESSVEETDNHQIQSTKIVKGQEKCDEVRSKRKIGESVVTQEMHGDVSRMAPVETASYTSTGNQEKQTCQARSVTGFIEQSEKSMSFDVHESEKRTTNNLPRWQQELMAGARTISPVTSTLTRSSSDISIASSRELPTPGSGLHPWQSLGNESDDMFETDPGHPPNDDGENLQSSSSPQQPSLKLLLLHELTQDIFHHHVKDPAEKLRAENKLQAGNGKDVEKVESHPQEDVVSSQDDAFCLHLTQSQSSSVASQPRPEKHVLINVDTREPRELEGHLSKDNVKDCVTLTATTLQQTAVGHPSTSGHHQDICSTTDSDNESQEMGNQNIPGQPSTMSDSSSSTESGLVKFHFTPPAMLLKPVPRTPLHCLEVTSETDQGSSQEIVGDVEFAPATSQCEKTNSVPPLSFSQPVPCDADGDSQELRFNLQKEVLAPSRKTPTAVDHSARPIFTSVKERFQPACINPPDDEIDLFEFRYEDYASSLRLRKQSSISLLEDEDCAEPKRKKKRLDNTGEGGVDREQEDKDNASKRGSKERYWKIVKTRVTTTIKNQTETETRYTSHDGAVITEETRREISEPSYNTSIEEKETREEVDEIPGQVNADEEGVNDGEEGRGSHVETLERITAVKQPRDSRNSIACHSRAGAVKESVETRLNNKCGQTSTADNADESSSPALVSPQLFPGSCDSASSASSLDHPLEKTRRTKGNSISPLKKQTSDDASSSRRQKRKPSSVDKSLRRTSRRSSSSPREILRLLHEGTRVFALWFDKHYYPGHVVSKCRNDAKYHIKFDDGDRGDVQEQCVIVVEYLPRDQPVMYCEETRGDYFDGVIKGFYKNGDERGYSVIAVDKKIVRCPRSNVRLTAEQAAIFLSLSCCETNQHNPSAESRPNEPTPSINLVTRAARPLADRNTNTKRPSPKTVGKRRENVDKVLESSSKMLVETRVEKRSKTSVSETPKSSHKSTGKKTRSGGRKALDKSGIKDSDVHTSRVRRRLSTVMNSPLDKTKLIPTRSSPRKHPRDTTENSENLILPRNKELFRGFGFVFTGGDVTCVPGDENSPGEQEEVFIRKEVARQVTAGGGEVMDTFPEDYPSDSCFLLSNTCQTTAKYFHALVLGIPCLSHAWVRDCCRENRLVSFKNYLLPAGRDLVTERLIEEQNSRNALRGLKVHLVGDVDFKKHWSEVLNAARCEIIQKMPTNVIQRLNDGDNNFACDVIVINGHVAHSTIQKARLLNIPTASIQWLKQCILTGRRVDFNAHESFIYRIE